MEQAVVEYQEPVRRFNPNDHIMQIPNKGGKSDYLPVQWRLVWFRELCPQGTIETQEIVVDLMTEFEGEAYVWNADKKRSEKVLKRAPGYARFRAIVHDGKGGCATATKTEKGVDFPDFVEKAETGAVGRALAMLGYGTQFAEMELSEEERIVDAPVDRKPAKSYQERKPFVEGSVSVKEESKPALQTVPAQPQAQDAQPDKVPAENMQQLINRCRYRATKHGYKTMAQYEAYCQEIIHKNVPVTLTDVGSLNADMEQREQHVKAS